jgi:hypothetical protein
VLARAAIRPSTREPWRGWFSTFVAGTFLFGWVLGLVSVLKLWNLSHAPRWMIVSGVGYVTLMVPPALIGFVFAWFAGRLAARGWGRASLALAGAGVTGLVAGLLVL